MDGTANGHQIDMTFPRRINLSRFCQAIQPFYSPQNDMKFSSTLLRFDLIIFLSFLFSVVDFSRNFLEKISTHC